MKSLERQQLIQSHSCSCFESSKTQANQEISKLKRLLREKKEVGTRPESSEMDKYLKQRPRDAVERLSHLFAPSRNIKYRKLAKAFSSAM